MLFSEILCCYWVLYDAAKDLVVLRFSNRALFGASNFESVEVDHRDDHDDTSEHGDSQPGDSRHVGS